MAKMKNRKFTTHKNNNIDIKAMKNKMKQQVEDNAFVEAMDTMAEIAKTGTLDAEIMYLGSYCYMMTGDDERAAKWVTNVLNLEPANYKARILLGRICLAEDRNEDALAVFEYVLENGRDKLDEQDEEDLEDLLDYYRYNEMEMLVDNYPNIADYLGIEEVEQEEEEVTVPETKDDAADRAKAAVARLRALLESKKQEESKQEESVPEPQPEAAEYDEVCENKAENEGTAFDVEGVSAQIMAKPASLKEKVKLFNTFAAGCYMNGDYQSAFDLLNGALALDPEEPYVIKNLAYVCSAAGEKEQAMEIASKLPMIDFGLLNYIK